MKKKIRLCKKRYAKKVHKKASAVFKNTKMVAEMLRVHYNQTCRKYNNLNAFMFFEIVVLTNPNDYVPPTEVGLLQKRFIRVVSREMRRNA